MTQAKHTPGPWTYEPVAANPKEGISIWAAQALGRNSNIVRCYALDQIGIEGAEANARLIAAAPELLASLDECLEVVAECCNCLLNTPELARAIAAIAKARGHA